MSIYDVNIGALDGSPFDLSSLEGHEVLVVNVASKCGLTPQYTGLEELQRALRRPRLHGARRPVQPVRGSGARERRGDPDVLFDDLRRHLPDHGEGGRQRARSVTPSTSA